MVENDRRAGRAESVRILKLELNTAQREALDTLERFGWYLMFVRGARPGPVVGVLCDPDLHKYATLDELGNLHENPTAHFRG